jgi:hypothetical protein
VSEPITDYARGYADGYDAGRAHERTIAGDAAAKAATAHADAIIDARLEMHDEVLGRIHRQLEKSVRAGANNTEIMTIRAIIQSVRKMFAEPDREESET